MRISKPASTRRHRIQDSTRATCYQFQMQQFSIDSEKLLSRREKVSNSPRTRENTWSTSRKHSRDLRDFISIRSNNVPSSLKHRISQHLSTLPASLAFGDRTKITADYSNVRSAKIQTTLLILRWKLIWILEPCFHVNRRKIWISRS